MKKIAAVCLLAIAPAFVFADLQVGAVGLYAGAPFGLASAAGDSSIPFGVEARWKFLYVFEAGVSSLFLSGASPSFAFLTDIGVVFDVDRFTFGFGVGPDFSIGLGGAGAPATTKLNFKMSGEVNLGMFSVGLVAFDPITSLSELRHNWPWIGVTVLVTILRDQGNS